MFNGEGIIFSGGGKFLWRGKITRHPPTLYETLPIIYAEIHVLQ